MQRLTDERSRGRDELVRTMRCKEEENKVNGCYGAPRIAAETKAYRPIPVITDFTDENVVDRMKEQIQLNYNLRQHPMIINS